MEAMEESTSEIDIKPSYSESEEEEGESDSDIHFLKLDECCLICGQVAITYDFEGNVVKRERDDDENADGIESQRHQFTNQDLFSFLCRCFKVKKEEWNFHSGSKDLFPFCEMCEFLLVSLSEIYCRLDELEEVLRGKMVEAEEDKFWKEALYVNHNRRYLTFRKQVLKEKFKGNKIQKKRNSSEPVQIISSVCIAKSDIVSREAIALPPVEPEHSEIRQLRSRSFKIMKSNPSHAKLKKEESGSDYSSKDEEPEIDMHDLLQNDWRASTTADCMSDDASDSDSAFLEKNMSKTTTMLQKRKVTVNKKFNSDPLSNSGKRFVKKYVRKPSKCRAAGRKAPLRNPRKPVNSTWKNEYTGYMIINPETGNIRYTTGYGNRFRSTRTVLEFIKLGDEAGYQCCTCLDVVPYESQRLKQQSRFRTHFIRTHSPRYMCRICPNPDKCSSSEELLQHVISFHGFPDLQTYHKSVGALRLKRSMDKRIELRKKRSILYSDNVSSCQICGMPFTNLEVNTIRQHNKSHLNDEERQEIDQMDDNLSLIKTYQCHTCGKSLRGTLSLRSHMRIHSAEEKTVCHICGESVKWIGPHVKMAHSNSTFDTYYSKNSQSQCKVCGMPFAGLPKYAVREHKRSHRILKGSKKEVAVGVQTQYNCEVCGMPLNDLRKFTVREHIWSHQSQEERQNRIETKSQSNGQFTCHMCGKLFMKESYLRLHERTHSGNKCVCSICGETYKWEQNLDKHIAKVHADGTWKGPFVCNYPSCAISLETDSKLFAHVEKEHSKSEGAQKKVMCWKCGKVLASSWALKLHGLVHSKERNFKCGICLKTFPLKATLLNHEAQMHGVGSKCATFKCDQPGCNVEYRSDIYLKSHLRRVHGIYVRKNVKKTGSQ